MVSLTCSASREEGVTLVTGRVENGPEPRRVRVRSRLDGPLWPPRRHGVPADGWDDEAFECVLAAGESRPIGAASPASPVDPPLEVVETEPADPEAGIEPRVPVPSVDATADGVVRALGTPSPPRDAVPTVGSHDDGAGPTESTDRDAEPGDSTAPNRPPDDRGGTGGVGSAAAPERVADAESLDSALEAVASRIETAERLSATTRLPEATAILETVGGVAGVRELDAQLERDADRLDALAGRTAELAERAEAATVPVAELDRVR